MSKQYKEFTAKYGNHEIILTQEENDDWYIIVTAHSGERDYDGWWTNSKEATIGQALDEAIKGAIL